MKEPEYRTEILPNNNAKLIIVATDGHDADGKPKVTERPIIGWHVVSQPMPGESGVWGHRATTPIPWGGDEIDSLEYCICNTETGFWHSWDADGQGKDSLLEYLNERNKG